MDPITLTGIAALDAALVGAGVGAATSAVTGGDPLKGALIGGVTGGGGSLLGGAGGAAAGGASKGVELGTKALPAAAEAATPLTTQALEQSVNAISTNLAPQAIGGAGVNLGSLGYEATQGANLLGNLGNGITQTANPLLNLNAAGNLASGMPTFMDNIYGMPNQALESLKNNPVKAAGLGMNVYDRINAQPQQMQAQPGQVSRGKGSVQYEPLLTTQVPRRKYPLSLLG
jgi:hypothetical protein